MKRSRFVLVAVVTAVSLLAASAAAGAGTAQTPSWTIDPGEGPAGTTVTFEGTCTGYDGVYLRLAQGSVSTERDDPITPGAPWSFDLVVPEDASPGEMLARKQCFDRGDDGSFLGGEATEDQSFTVTRDTSLTVSPSSGPVGTTFTISGTDCEPDGPGEANVSVPGADPTERVVTADPEGDWSAQFAVPATTTPGELTIDATCDLPTGDRTAAVSAARGGGSFLVYDQATFTVTATPTTEGTTSTTEGTTTTTEADDDSGVLPESEVADEVVRTPALTG